MVTQKELILNYIRDFGSITPMEAFADLGITKLATVVSRMRRIDGIDFDIRMVTAKNRYGRPVRFAKYSLKEKKND